MTTFHVGQHVHKPEGYPYDSTVVAVFQKLDGQTRYVCESDVIPGMLHIFSGRQLRADREPVQVAELGGAIGRRASYACVEGRHQECSGDACHCRCHE